MIYFIFQAENYFLSKKISVKHNEYEWNIEFESRISTLV